MILSTLFIRATGSPLQPINLILRFPSGVGRLGQGGNMRPKRTILCVDDNEQALSIRKVMLETRGYRVVACGNGQEAWEVFRKGGVDLVLSDLLMPGLDGAAL